MFDVKSGFADNNQESLQRLVIPKSGQMPADPTEAKKRAEIPYTVTCASFELRMMDPLWIQTESITDHYNSFVRGSIMEPLNWQFGRVT